MEIEFDPDKRRKIMLERGLDLADTWLVFDSSYVEIVDDGRDYGEVRHRFWGYLRGQRVSLVWTQLGKFRRIITVRNAHESEHKARRQTLD